VHHRYRGKLLHDLSPEAIGELGALADSEPGAYRDASCGLDVMSKPGRAGIEHLADSRQVLTGVVHFGDDVRFHVVQRQSKNRASRLPDDYQDCRGDKQRAKMGSAFSFCRVPIAAPDFEIGP
jgi:hypothetical protein